MSDGEDLKRRILDLPPKRVALLALELQEQLTRERGRAGTPIAIVGMACRLPGGVDSTRSYWELLQEGRDAIVETPADRWVVDELYDPDPDAPGRIATRWGGYVTDVAHFDPRFFSISPREASSMDPQQRLMLEVAWRAFEDAAIPPAQYRGDRVGVFVGVCNNEYITRLFKEGVESIDLYYSSGNAYSVVAGRLSFFFGFQGPAVAIDTACSSSLVALHAACQSLRAGECKLALAGGVNVLSAPESTIALSRSHMMAPDGRCKTFDESADGFVRGEGCGVVILKPLSDALRDRDRIHAVIRGSAVGQDGRSTGLTVPNGPAQEQVIRDALARSPLEPSDVDYIEAHGTGTSLGDPIEIRALGRVFGPGRARPLLVGSVKTNFGHLESAAGIAGVMKAALAIREGEIPPHLHLHQRSSRIDWDEFPIDVPTQRTPWPETSGLRRAGVSSFGFSGTNAHVILEESPGREVEDPELRPSRPVDVLLVSGATPEARDTLTDAYREALSAHPEAFRDFCHTSRSGRAALGWRRAAVAADVHEALAMLRGEPEAPELLEGVEKAGDPPGLVFVFTGQGAQHPGMGRSLYQVYPAFREAIDRCAAILDPELGMPLTDLLFEGEGEDAPIYRTTLAQPGVVAFEWALSELWRAWGVQPAAVIGHSLGEFVAATVAGVLDLEEMLRLVCARGRLLDSLVGGDRMSAVFTSPEVVSELIEPHGDDVAIGAYNGPENTVVSGKAGAVGAVLEACARLGVTSRDLRLDKGFHSPRVEPILDEFQAIAASVAHKSPTVPIAWNVTGEVGGNAPPPAGYWRDHARRPVRFMQGVRAIADLGLRHFLEVGPHPTLSPLVAQTLGPDGQVTVPSLRRGGDALRDMAEATARLWVVGAEIEWNGPFDASEDWRIEIPGHPLRGERYWVEPPATSRPVALRGSTPGVRLPAAVPIYETVFTPDAPGVLREHLVAGRSVIPGPLYLELARAAAAAEGRPASMARDVRFVAAATVPEEGLRLQTVLQPEGSELRFKVLSAPMGGDGAQWREHASGVLGVVGEVPPAHLDAPADASWESTSVEDHLQRLRDLGFDLGPSAARYEDLEVSVGYARAGLSGGAERWRESAVERAMLLDAGIQVLGAALAHSVPQSTPEPRMLATIDRIVWLGEASEPVRCIAALHEGEGGSATGDVALLDADARPVARADGVGLRKVRPGMGSSGSSLHHRVRWQASDPQGKTGESPLAAADIERAGGQVAEGWPQIAAAAGLDAFTLSLAGLRARVAGHIWAALEELGLPASSRQPLQPETLIEQLGVVQAHGRLLPRLLDILVDEGYLEGDRQRGYVPTGARPSLEGVGGAGSTPTVDVLVDRCGPALAGVLRGEVDPVALLFPDSDEDVTRRIYSESPFGVAFNEAVGAAVAALATDVPAEAELRVLEVGAGSGSTTVHVLEAIGDRPLRYLFTDLSPTLVQRSQVRLAESRGMSFRTLDLEKDFESQGVGPGTQDVVVAANVVHATRDLSESLRNLYGCLSPGGVVLLLEGTTPEPWVDITFGLTDGWWRFTDREVRPEYPLVSADRWQEVLEESGFREVQALPDSDALLGQALLVARRPREDVTPVRAYDSEDAMGQQLEPLRPSDDRAAVVFDARGKDEAAVLDAMRANVSSPSERRLWVVTESAQAVVAGDVPEPSAAAAWGLARTYSLEQPQRWGGVIDLAPGTEPEAAAQQILASVRAGDEEDQVAWRGGARYVPRLTSIESPGGGLTGIQPGTYVVSGGLGGLGLKVAQWLAEKGATHVALLGRTGARGLVGDDPRLLELAELDAAGVGTSVHAVDVADEAALGDVLAGLRMSGPPIRGVVHAAAVYGAGPLGDLDAATLDKVMAPKVVGARNLVELTREDPLDFLVLFSSTTAILGVAGLGAYAAANEALDALAVASRAEGVPALSVNWGIWDSMRLASAEEQERYAQAGLRPMATHAALEGLGELIVEGTANAVVVDADWDRLRSVYEARRRRPILEELRTEKAAESVATGVADGPGTALDELARLPDDEREERVLGTIEEEARAIIRLAPSEFLDRQEGFFDMGMDSLMSVELKTRLERRFQVTLPATLTFNYPTVEAVGGYVLGLLRPARRPARRGSGRRPRRDAGRHAGRRGAGGAARASPPFAEERVGLSPVRRVRSTHRRPASSGHSAGPGL